MKTGEDRKRESLRVLVIAEAANPDWSSVPLIGWSHCRAIREQVDVHLVTQVRNRKAIVAQGWQEHSDFTAIDTEVLDRPLYALAKILRGGEQLSWTISTAVSNLTYPYFEYRIWRQFRKRLLAGEFDVVHRLTPLTPTAPSYLAHHLRRIGVPLVIGPLNGGLDWPKGFEQRRQNEREWLHKFRFMYRFMPWQRSGREDAAAIICGSGTTYREISRDHPDKTLFLPENGVDISRFHRTRSAIRNANAPLRIAFVGRLVPCKGCDMLLRAALPLMKTNKVCIDIVGDGAELGALKGFVADHRLEEQQVKFHGWIAHEKVQDILTHADILALPSIREFGGGVVLEAMALGVVPMVADYGGPAELVTDDCGFRLDMSTPEALEKDIRKTLNFAEANRSVIEARGAACLRTVQEEHLWARRAEKVVETYRWVLGRQAKPDLRLPVKQRSGEAHEAVV